MARYWIAGALLASALAAPAAASSSPFDGTWKVDLPATQLPTKPDIFMLKGGTYECRSCAPAFSVKADGQFHPVKGHPYFDAVAIKVASPRSIVETDRKGGKVTDTTTSTVSPDGKMMAFAFVDTSAASGVAVKGGGTERRVASQPPGSHAISGSWRAASFNRLSDAGSTITLKVDGDRLTMSQPTGQSYTARFGGPPVPLKGDTAGTMVSVAKVGARSYRSTDHRNGKVVDTVLVTVAPDGKTLTAMVNDKLQGTSTTYKATRQ